MIYKIKFLPSALKEWDKLDPPIRHPFKKKLEERVGNPRVPASQLNGFQNAYKIKLRSVGYRLIYEVDDEFIIIYIISIGKRDKNWVYSQAKLRINNP